MARNASADAGTSFGVSHRRWMPSTRHDRRLAVDDATVGESRMERQRLRRHRHHLAADGQDAVDRAGRLPRSRRPRRRSSRPAAGCRPRGRPGPCASPSAVSGKRYWRRSLISGSASASAAMQLRMSPTGGIPRLVRSTPDEPPSSATVTTAVRLLVCSLSPRRRADRPVPPPIATIRGPRARNRFW